FTIGEYAVSVEAAAQRHGIAAIRAPVQSAAELQHAIETFADQPDGSLIELPPPLVADQRLLMYRLVQKHRLPAIYGQRTNVAEGNVLWAGHRRPLSTSCVIC